MEMVCQFNAASLVLRTDVQANPLHVARPKRFLNVHPGMLGADKPLIVPMEMRISNVKLRGITVLVLDKAKGVTLAFKNDPLENVVVNSVF
jgi:distribution and morphology protein 34